MIHTGNSGYSSNGYAREGFGRASIGMLRAEISCRVPEFYDWSRFGTGGAIFEINEVISDVRLANLGGRAYGDDLVTVDGDSTKRVQIERGIHREDNAIR